MGILGLGLQGQVLGLDLGLVPKSLLPPLRAVCPVKTMHAMRTGNRENVSKSGWLISGGPTRSVARGRASFTAWRVSSKHVITYRRVAHRPSHPARPACFFPLLVLRLLAAPARRPPLEVSA